MAPDASAPVHGTARLASMLFAGESFGDVLDMLGPQPPAKQELAGWLMDKSWLYALNFSPFQAGQFQEQALAMAGVFRIRGPLRGLRLVALCAPGDLMVNAPLDFIAPSAGAELHLAFLRSGRLPANIPEHDVAIVAASESAPAALETLLPLYQSWRRPILNDPALIRLMSRDGLAAALSDLPGVYAPPTWVVSHEGLADAITAPFPLLVRPIGSHGGNGLAKLDTAAAFSRYVGEAEADAFYLSRFVDYRGPEGWYAKYRIAFVDGAPFICHMAASEHWMVHYLSAGMDGDEAKRQAEQRAMETFEADFATRHRVALAAVAAAIGLDYFSIDCAEAPDGRLLVFEADVAAIIHSMDPPDLYPYKEAAMQRCYRAFGAMLRRRTTLSASVAS